MKNLFILIALILIVAFTGNANAGTKRLTGELVNEGDSLVVYTIEGRVLVHSETEVEDCFYGEYELSAEPKGEAELKLLDTVICRGKGKKRNFNFELPEEKKEVAQKGFCPMVYAPVCGMLDGIPTTFGNMCELKNAEARKLFLGVCERAISSGISGHQEINSYELNF